MPKPGLSCAKPSTEGLCLCLSRSSRLDVVWNKLRRTPGKWIQTLTAGSCVDSAASRSQAGILITTVRNSDNYDPSKAIMKSLEIMPLNFTPHVTEDFNTTSIMDELLTTLQRCRNTPPDATISITKSSLTFYLQERSSYCLCKIECGQGPRDLGIRLLEKSYSNKHSENRQRVLRRK